MKMDSILDRAIETEPNLSMFHLGVTLGYGKEGNTGYSELID